MSIRFLLAATLCVSGLGVCASAQAANPPAVAVVPTPDLSRLPADRARELRSQRESFEKSRSVLIGDPLAETYALLGAAYARNGFFDAADIALNDAIALAPENGRWQYMRGMLDVQRQKDAAAKEAFERALELTPGYLPIRMAVVNIRMASGDLDGARKLLDPYARGKEAVPLATLGDIAMQQKRYADAVDAYKRALALAPEASRLNARLADALAAAGDARGAAQARANAGDGLPTLYDPIGRRMLGERAQNAAAAQPPTLSARDQALGTALNQLAADQIEAARKTLDAALQKSPNDSMLLALYSRVEAASGNLPMAQTRLDMALRADPNNGMAYVGEGLLREIRNDDGGAEKAYKKAIEVQPGLAASRMALGTLYARNKRYDDAVAQYRAALGIDAHNSETWMRLVATNAVAGRCADTLKDLNTALRTTPNEPFLLQLFVRNASTCPAIGTQEKRMALDYSQKLYRAVGGPEISEAYALALAANGRWDDAVKTQEGVLFIVLRDGGTQALAPYKEILEQLRAHRLPAWPWAAQSPLFHPQRPSLGAATAAPAK